MEKPASPLNRLRALWADGRCVLGAIATIPSVHAKVPLDLGCMGVCFPFISTRADAEAAVRAVRYPPIGKRAWGPFYAPPRWGLSPRDYQDRIDAEVLSIATVEQVDALHTIGEVVATPGLDVAAIGVGDLATSMGHRGRVDHPEVQAAAMRLEEAIRRSPVLLGGVAPTPEQANAMTARG